MKPDNPSFFPRLGYEHEGVTLRDYFAGQVIIGLLSKNDETLKIDFGVKEFSASAYIIADAMLLERTRTPDGMESV